MFIEQHAVDVYMEFNRNKIQFKKKKCIYLLKSYVPTPFSRGFPLPQLLNVKPLRTHRLSYHRFVGSINM